MAHIVAVEVDKAERPTDPTRLGLGRTSARGAAASGRGEIVIVVYRVIIVPPRR